MLSHEISIFITLKRLQVPAKVLAVFFYCKVCIFKNEKDRETDRYRHAAEGFFHFAVKALGDQDRAHPTDEGHQAEQ